MVKKKPQDNPADFIARYIENGLKKSTGESIQVKTITIEASGPQGNVTFQWTHPFGKVKVVSKTAGRLIETE